MKTFLLISVAFAAFLVAQRAMARQEQLVAGCSRAVCVVEWAVFLKISTLGVADQRVNVIVDLVTQPEKARTFGDGYRVGARIATGDETILHPSDKAADNVAVSARAR